MAQLRCLNAWRCLASESTGGRERRGNHMRSLLAFAIATTLAGPVYAQGLPPLGIPMGTPELGDRRDADAQGRRPVGHRAREQARTGEEGGARGREDDAGGKEESLDRQDHRRAEEDQLRRVSNKQTRRDFVGWAN